MYDPPSVFFVFRGKKLCILIQSSPIHFVFATFAIPPSITSNGDGGTRTLYMIFTLLL